MCEECRDGMDHAVYDLVEAFLEVYPSAHGGPGHITLSDKNMADAHIDYCLEQPARDFSDDGEDDAVRHFLRVLKAIPAARRGEA